LKEVLKERFPREDVKVIARVLAFAADKGSMRYEEIELEDNIKEGLEKYVKRRKLVDKYVGKRKFICGICTRFKMDEMEIDYLIKRVEEYIKLGVRWVNFRMDPDTENLKLLDEITPVIHYFKEKYEG